MTMAKARCISLLFMFMLLAFTHSQALAGFYSGNDLVPLMREADKAEANMSGADLAKAFEYGAYVIGVHDATEYFLHGTPADATKGQIIAVVSKYLKNHPEQWSEAAADLVIKALKEAFPSKKLK
jgi:hypothetical protein